MSTACVICTHAPKIRWVRFTPAQVSGGGVRGPGIEKRINSRVSDARQGKNMKNEPNRPNGVCGEARVIGTVAKGFAVNRSKRVNRLKDVDRKQTVHVHFHDLHDVGLGSSIR